MAFVVLPFPSLVRGTKYRAVGDAGALTGERARRRFTWLRGRGPGPTDDVRVDARLGGAGRGARGRTGGLGAAATVQFQPNIVHVGDSGTGVVTLTNDNSDPNTGATNTVCNIGEACPNSPETLGISVVPSCQALAPGTTCAAGGAGPGRLPAERHRHRPGGLRVSGHDLRHLAGHDGRGRHRALPLRATAAQRHRRPLRAPARSAGSTSPTRC